MRKLIKGGTIISATGCMKGDVLIDGDKIEAVGKDLKGSDCEVIDATGLYVRPGGIDIHTHLDWPFQGTVTCDDFESGTKAAAVGGTTMVVDFATQVKGTTLKETLQTWQKRANGKACVDYGFHVAITDLQKKGVIDEIKELPELGVTSVKCFLAYKGGYMVDDGSFFRILKQANQYGLLTMAHCENGDVIDVAMQDALANGQTGPQMQPVVRTMAVEAEATFRATRLAAMAEAPLYIVHCSCRDSLEHIQTARDQGLPIFAETCSHYLVLDDTVYNLPGFESAKYVCAPPIRPQWNQPYLWSGLRNGSLQAVNSDHCPLNYHTQKQLGKDDFTLIPNGAPGIEDRLAILFSEGVLKGHISLAKWVEVTSTSQARLFGLYPKKGIIAAGSDADIVLWDANATHVISVKDQVQNIDYNAFEGLKVTGQPSRVYSRGELVYEGRNFVGQPGSGKYIKRSRFDYSQQ